MSLSGRKILIVEDEALVAMMLEMMIEELGALVEGPMTTLDAALAAAQTTTCDAALLDLNLDGQTSYPVAEILQRRAIPFAFTTGAGSAAIDNRFARVPAITKPFFAADIEAVLTALVKTP